MRGYMDDHITSNYLFFSAHIMGELPSVVPVDLKSWMDVMIESIQGEQFI